MTKKTVQRRVVSDSLFEFVLPARVRDTGSVKAKVSCDLPYVTLDDERVLAEEHDEKTSRQRDEASKRRSGREFRWGAAVAKRRLEEEAYELYDLETEADKARSRRYQQLVYDRSFAARCGELDALLAIEVKRQALVDQAIADLEQVGAYRRAEAAKLREDAYFAERLGELDALISQLGAELSYAQGQYDAIYCSEEAVEIDCDTKRGEFLAASTEYDETMRLKKEVNRIRHAQRKRGYYGVNDEGWLIACGSGRSKDDCEKCIETHNAFEVLECQPLPERDSDGEVPKNGEQKRLRKVVRKPKRADNFDELMAEAAKWNAECEKQGATLMPSRAAYEAIARKRVRSFGVRGEEKQELLLIASNTVEVVERLTKANGSSGKETKEEKFRRAFGKQGEILYESGKWYLRRCNHTFGTSVQNGDIQWFALTLRKGVAIKTEAKAPRFGSYYEHGAMMWYQNKVERCGLVEVSCLEASRLKGKSGTNCFGGTLLGVIHDIDYDYYGAVIHTSDPVEEIQYHVDHHDDWVDIGRSFGEERGKMTYTPCSKTALTFMCLLSSVFSCEVVSEIYGTYLVNEIQQLDWPSGETECMIPPCIGCSDLECGVGYDLATWQYICNQADLCIESEALVMLFNSNYSVDLDCMYNTPRQRTKRDTSSSDETFSSLVNKFGFDASAIKEKATSFKDKVVEYSRNSIVIAVTILLFWLSLTLLGVSPVVSMIFIVLSFYISSVQSVNIAKDRTNCRIEYRKPDLTVRSGCATNTRMFSGVIFCNQTGVSGCGWYITFGNFKSDMRTRALSCVSDDQMKFWIEQTPTQKFVRSYCAANPLDIVGLTRKVVEYYFGYLQEPSEAHLKRISDEFSRTMTHLLGTKYYEILYKICVGVICLVALLILPFPLGAIVAIMFVSVYIAEAASVCQTSMVMTQSGLQYHVGGLEKTVTRGKVKVSRGFCLRWHEKETVVVDNVQSEVFTQHKIDVLDQTPNFHTTDIVRIVATPKIDHLCSYRCKKSWLDTFEREERLISGGAYVYKCNRWTRERKLYWGSSWDASYEHYDGWTCNGCPGASYSFKKSCIYWKREDECVFQNKIVESLTMKVRYTKNEVEEDRVFTVTRDSPFTLGGVTFHLLSHKHIKYDVINCQDRKYLVNDRSAIPQDVIQYNEKSEITERYLFSRCSTHYVCKTYSNSCNDKNGAICTWKSLTHAMPPRSLSETTMLIHPEAKQTWGHFELLVSGQVTETTICKTFRVHPTGRVDFTTSSSGFVEFTFDAHKLPCIPELNAIDSDECEVTILRPTLTDNATEVSMGVTCRRVQVANFSVDGQQVVATVRYVKFANYDLLENAAIEFWSSGGEIGSFGEAISDWFHQTFSFKWPNLREIGVKVLIVLVIYMVSPPLAIFVVIFYFLINGAFAVEGNCYGYVANSNGRTIMNKWLYEKGISYNTHGFFFGGIPDSACDSRRGQIVKEKCDQILYRLESLKWYSNSPVNDRLNDVTCRHEYCKHGIGADLSFEEYVDLIEDCAKTSVTKIWYPRECTKNVINEVTTNKSANINCPVNGLVLNGKEVIVPFSVAGGERETVSFYIKLVIVYVVLSVLFVNLEMPDINNLAALCHNPAFELLVDITCIVLNPLNLMVLLLVKRLHLSFCCSCLVIIFASVVENTLIALVTAFVRIAAMVYSKSIHFPFVASNIEYWTKYDDRGSLFTSPASKVVKSICDSGCQTEGNMVVQSCDIVLERYNGVWIRKELHSEDIEPLAREDCPVDPYKYECGIKISVSKTSDDVDGDSNEHRNYIRSVVDFESNSRPDLNKATPKVTEAAQLCINPHVKCMLDMFEPFINNNTVGHLALEYSNCEIIQSWFGRLESIVGKEWESQVAIMQLTTFSKRGFCFAYGGGIYTAMHVTHGDSIFHPGYKPLPCTFNSEEEDICVYGDPLELEQPKTGDLYYVVNPKLGVYVVLSLQKEQWGNKYYRRIVSGDYKVINYADQRGTLFRNDFDDEPATQSLFSSDSCNLHGWSGLPICRISDGKPVGIYTGTEKIDGSIWIKNVSPTKIPAQPFNRIINDILDTPTVRFTLDAPTGAGKTTRFVLQLAEQSILKNKPIHILVANPLLTITYAYEFVKHTLLEKSSLRDKISMNLQTSSVTKYETKKLASITYMTYGCVLNQMKNNASLPYDIVLLDECHTDQPHVVAVLTAKNLPRHVLMTATPLFGGLAPSYRSNIDVRKITHKSTAAQGFVELYTNTFVKQEVFEDLCKPGSIIFCGSIAETDKVKNRIQKQNAEAQVVTVSSKTPLREVDSSRDDCVWVTTDALMSGVTIAKAVRGIAQGRQFRQTFSVVEQRAELMARKTTLSEDVQMAGRIARTPNSFGVWYKLDEYYHEPSWSPHLLLSALTALNARKIQYDRKYYECVKDLVAGIADDDELWVQADKNSIDGVSFKKFLESGTIPYHFDAKLPGKERGTHEDWFELSKKYRELSRFDENCAECGEKKRRLRRDHEEHAVGTIGLAVVAAGTTAGCLLAYMCSHQQVLVNDVWWPQREKNFNGLLSGVTHDFVLGYTEKELEKYEGFYDPHYKATFKAWKPDRSNDEGFIRHNLMIKVPTSTNYQMYHVKYRNHHRIARNYKLDEHPDLDWYDIRNPVFSDTDGRRRLMPDELDGFNPRRCVLEQRRRKKSTLIKGFIQQLIMLFGDNTVTRSIRDALVPYEYESDRMQRHAIFTYVPFYHWFCIQTGTTPVLFMEWLKTYGFAFLPAVMAPLGNEIAGSVGSFILAIAATYMTFYTVGIKISYDVLAGVICANGFVTWLLNKFGNASLKKNLLIDTQAGLRDRFTKPFLISAVTMSAVVAYQNGHVGLPAVLTNLAEEASKRIGLAPVTTTQSFVASVVEGDLVSFIYRCMRFIDEGDINSNWVAMCVDVGITALNLPYSQVAAAVVLAFLFYLSKKNDIIKTVLIKAQLLKDRKTSTEDAKASDRYLLGEDIDKKLVLDAVCFLSYCVNPLNMLKAMSGFTVSYIYNKVTRRDFEMKDLVLKSLRDAPMGVVYMAKQFYCQITEIANLILRYFGDRDDRHASPDNVLSGLYELAVQKCSGIPDWFKQSCSKVKQFICDMVPGDNVMLARIRIIFKKLFFKPLLWVARWFWSIAQKIMGVCMLMSIPLIGASEVLRCILEKTFSFLGRVNKKFTNLLYGFTMSHWEYNISIFASNEQIRTCMERSKMYPHWKLERLLAGLAEPETERRRSSTPNSSVDEQLNYLERMAREDPEVSMIGVNLECSGGGYIDDSIRQMSPERLEEQDRQYAEAMGPNLGDNCELEALSSERVQHCEKFSLLRTLFDMMIEPPSEDMSPTANIYVNKPIEWLQNVVEVADVDQKTKRESNIPYYSAYLSGMNPHPVDPLEEKTLKMTEDTIWPDLYGAEVIGNTQIAFEKLKTILTVNVKQKRSGREALPESASQVTSRGFYVMSNLDKNDSVFRDWDLKTMSSKIKDKSMTVLDATPGFGGSVNYLLQSMKGGSLHIYQRQKDPWPLKEDLITPNINVKVIRSDQFCYKEEEFDFVVCDSVSDIKSIVSRNDKEFVLQCHNVVRQGGSFWVSCGLLDILNWPQELNCYEHAKFHISPTPNADKFYFWVQLGGRTTTRKIYVNRFYGILCDLVRIHLLKLKYAVKKDKKPVQLYHPVIQKNKTGAIPMINYTQNIDRDRYSEMFEMTNTSYKIRHRLDRLDSMRKQPRLMKSFSRLQNFQFLTSVDFKRGVRLLPGKLRNQLIVATWDQERVKVTSDRVLVSNVLSDMLHDIFAVNWANTPITQVSKDLHKVDMAIVDRLDINNKVLLDSQVEKLLEASEFILQPPDRLFKLCTWEELGTFINRQGAAGMLDDVSKMGELYDDSRTRKLCEQIIGCLANGQDCPLYYSTCHHKVESKVSKRAVDGKIVDTLPALLKPVPRLIQYLSSYARLVDIWIFGSMMHYHMKVKKLYKYSNTGTPITHVGDDMHAAWEKHGGDDECIGVTGDASRWDHNLGPSHTYVEKECVKKFFEPSMHKIIETRYEHTAFPITFTDMGYAVSTAGQRQSGDYLTSWGNGLIHSLIQHVCWSKVLHRGVRESHEDLVEHRVDGDDNWHMMNFRHICVGREKDKFDEKAKLWEKIKRPGNLFDKEPALSAEISFDNILTRVARHYEEFGVKLRSGTHTGFRLHYQFSTVDFLSHTYTEIPIRCIKDGNYVQVRKYLPVRPYSEMFGKLLFTLKQGTSKYYGAAIYDHSRGREIAKDACEAIDIQTSKCMSYLFQYPHVMCIREFCLGVLSYLGGPPSDVKKWGSQFRVTERLAIDKVLAKLDEVKRLDWTCVEPALRQILDLDITSLSDIGTVSFEQDNFWKEQHAENVALCAREYKIEAPRFVHSGDYMRSTRIRERIVKTVLHQYRMCMARKGVTMREQIAINPVIIPFWGYLSMSPRLLSVAKIKVKKQLSEYGVELEPEILDRLVEGVEPKKQTESNERMKSFIEQTGLFSVTSVAALRQAGKYTVKTGDHTVTFSNVYNDAFGSGFQILSLRKLFGIPINCAAETVEDLQFTKRFLEAQPAVRVADGFEFQSMYEETRPRPDKTTTFEIETVKNILFKRYGLSRCETVFILNQLEPAVLQHNRGKVYLRSDVGDEENFYRFKLCYIDCTKIKLKRAGVFMRSVVEREDLSKLVERVGTLPVGSSCVVKVDKTFLHAVTIDLDSLSELFSVQEIFRSPFTGGSSELYIYFGGKGLQQEVKVSRIGNVEAASCVPLREQVAIFLKLLLQSNHLNMNKNLASAVYSGTSAFSDEHVGILARENAMIPFCTKKKFDLRVKQYEPGMRFGVQGPLAIWQYFVHPSLVHWFYNAYENEMDGKRRDVKVMSSVPRLLVPPSFKLGKLKIEFETDLGKEDFVRDSDTNWLRDYVIAKTEDSTLDPKHARFRNPVKKWIKLDVDDNTEKPSVAQFSYQTCIRICQIISDIGSKNIVCEIDPDDDGRFTYVFNYLQCGKVHVDREKPLLQALRKVGERMSLRETHEPANLCVTRNLSKSYDRKYVICVGNTSKLDEVRRRARHVYTRFVETPILNEQILLVSFREVNITKKKNLPPMRSNRIEPLDVNYSVKRCVSYDHRQIDISKKKLHTHICISCQTEYASFHDITRQNHGKLCYMCALQVYIQREKEAKFQLNLDRHDNPVTDHFFDVIAGAVREYLNELFNRALIMPMYETWVWRFTYSRAFAAPLIKKILSPLLGFVFLMLMTGCGRIGFGLLLVTMWLMAQFVPIVYKISYAEVVMGVAGYRMPAESTYLLAFIFGLSFMTYSAFDLVKLVLHPFYYLWPSNWVDILSIVIFNPGVRRTDRYIWNLCTLPIRITFDTLYYLTKSLLTYLISFEKGRQWATEISLRHARFREFAQDCFGPAARRAYGIRNYYNNLTRDFEGANTASFYFFYYFLNHDQVIVKLYVAVFFVLYAHFTGRFNKYVQILRLYIIYSTHWLNLWQDPSQIVFNSLKSNMLLELFGMGSDSLGGISVKTIPSFSTSTDLKLAACLILILLFVTLVDFYISFYQALAGTNALGPFCQYVEALPEFLNYHYYQTLEYLKFIFYFLVGCTIITLRIIFRNQFTEALFNRAALHISAQYRNHISRLIYPYVAVLGNILHQFGIIDFTGLANLQIILFAFHWAGVGYISDDADPTIHWSITLVMCLFKLIGFSPYVTLVLVLIIFGPVIHFFGFELIRYLSLQTAIRGMFNLCRNTFIHNILFVCVISNLTGTIHPVVTVGVIILLKHLTERYSFLLPSRRTVANLFVLDSFLFVLMYNTWAFFDLQPTFVLEYIWRFLFQFYIGQPPGS
ncbi:polyprotein [Beihai barnacle viurs 1]|uniref:polyprotein n=1 Tax=Beihai barnacle viurs 1 TaxID=1746057 RepID=UPI000706AC44|nr:polyprotein [Beihai barnacle viurs 1]ALL52889.1 polyprotein [Beihai barnacle viurs 1]